MDIANLQIKVQTQSAKQAADEVRKIGQAGTEAERSVEKLNQSMNKGAAASSKMEASFVSATSKMKNSANGLTGAVGGLISSFVGGLASAFSVVKGFEMADQFKLLEGRVKLATQSTDEFNKAFQGVIDISSKTGASLEATVSIFQRLSQTRAEIKATADEMLQFTETVSKLGVISGASGDALKFGLTQLGQSLSSDIMRAEEFNSIMENIPAVGKSIADEFGVSTGQLRALVIEGQVLSKDVFAAVLNQSEKVNAQFNEFPKTVGLAFRQAGIELLTMVGSIDKATGATTALSGLIWGLSKAAQAIGIAFNAVFTGIRTVMLSVGSAIVTVVRGTIESMNALIRMANKIPGVNIGQIGTDGVGSLQKSFYDATAESFMGGVSGAATATDKLVGSIAVQTGQSEAPKTATREISQDYKKLAQSLSGGSGAGGKAGRGEDAIQNFIIAQRDAIQALRDEQEAVGKTRSEIERLKIAREIDTAAAKVAVKLSGDKKAAFMETVEALKAERLAIYDVLEAQNKTFSTGAIQALKEYADAASDTAKSTKNIFEKSLKGIEDAFVQLATTGKLSFRDLASSIVEDLIRMQVQQSITGPASSFLGSALQSGIGSLFSSFSGVYTAGAGGYNPAKMAPPSKPAFATGGEFSVGGFGGTDSQLVSFKATPGEIVNVRHGSKDSGGGFAPVYNIDARGSEAGVEQRILKILKERDKTIEQRAMNAVSKMNKRDPRFLSRGG